MELAVVLVIVALLLGGLLMPLSTQRDGEAIRSTEKTLADIRDALIGFAIAQKRLPRPATSATDGSENPAACATETSCTGFIPWATLGVSKLDAWGKIIRYSVTPAFAGDITGTQSFSLTTIATKKVQTRDAAGNLIYLVGQATCSTTNQCVPAIIFSYGKNNWGTSDTGTAIADNSATNVDEDANHSGTTNFISRIFTNASTANGGEFDDMVNWISLNNLYNRMISAGQLP